MLDTSSFGTLHCRVGCTAGGHQQPAETPVTSSSFHNRIWIEPSTSYSDARELGMRSNRRGRGESLQRRSTSKATASINAAHAPEPSVDLGGGSEAPRLRSDGGGRGRDDGESGQPTFCEGPALLSLAAAVKPVSKPVVLTLVSFAVTRKAYAKITKMFIREYEERTGQSVRFRLSFGGSGTQARAVIDGLPADIVALALPLDVMKISEAGLIRTDWASCFPNSSIVVESIVAIVTRGGNPKGITEWDDLTRGDVQVVVANPKTAGVARWIFLALWGHKMSKGDTPAIDFVTKVFERVEVQPRDAREASDVFYKQGMGDALLTYENEAVFTNIMTPNAANRMPYALPKNNIRIQNPVAIVDANVDLRGPEVRDAATAFIEFLYTPRAQREFAACGFRSPCKEVAAETELPCASKLWTVDSRLGGWYAAQKKFFDDQGILDKIQREVGEKKLAERIAAAQNKVAHNIRQEVVAVR